MPEILNTVHSCCQRSNVVCPELADDRATIWPDLDEQTFGSLEFKAEHEIRARLLKIVTWKASFQAKYLF